MGICCPSSCADTAQWISSSSWSDCCHVQLGGISTTSGPNTSYGNRRGHHSAACKLCRRRCYRNGEVCPSSLFGKAATHCQPGARRALRMKRRFAAVRGSCCESATATLVLGLVSLAGYIGFALELLGMFFFHAAATSAVSMIGSLGFAVQPLTLHCVVFKCILK